MVKVVIWTRGIEVGGDQGLTLFDSVDWDMVDAEFYHLPCIHVQPVAIEEKQVYEGLSLKPNRAWGITSQKTLKYLKRYPTLWSLMMRDKVYCFGQQTLASMNKVEIPGTLICANTAHDFWKELISVEPTALLVAPGGKERAYDPRMLCNVFSVDLYETVIGASHADGSTLEANFVRDARQHWQGVVCFGSPSAVRGFCSVFEPHRNALFKNLSAIAIGETTAGAAQNQFLKVSVASSANYDALARKALELISAQ